MSNRRTQKARGASRGCGEGGGVLSGGDSVLVYKTECSGAPWHSSVNIALLNCTCNSGEGSKFCAMCILPQVNIFKN